MLTINNVVTQQWKMRITKENTWTKTNKQPELNLKVHVTHVCEVAFDLMKVQVYVIALKMYVCKGDQGIIATVTTVTRITRNISY